MFYLHWHVGVGMCFLSIGLLVLSGQTAQAQNEIIPPVKISSLEGGFTGQLEGDDGFGSSIVNIGDLDKDGLNEIAVGAPGDDDGHGKHGAVWILFLNADGTVRDHQKISLTEGGFTAATVGEVEFGSSAAELGDLDGDDIPDLAVMTDDHVYTLLLDSSGKVKSQNSGDIQSPCGSCRLKTIANIGDFDGDGVRDLGGSAFIVSGLTGSRNELFVWPMNSSGSLNPSQVTDREHGIGNLFSGFGDSTTTGFQT